MHSPLLTHAVSSPMNGVGMADERATKWQGLDVESEWEKFSQREHPQSTIWTSYAWVEAMHCAACSGRIQSSFKAFPGILQLQASAANKRVKVTWDATRTSPSLWFSKLDEIGYTALPINEFADIESRVKAQRLMLWRLLVALFCMMQVMMYAYPSYISKAGDMTADVSQLLKWASFILSLPVMFFSATPFLSQAWQSLKQRQLGMDVPVAIGIIATFVMSTLATFVPNGWWGNEVYFDSLTMFISFLLCGRWIELKLRNKTAGALDNLMRRVPSRVLKRDQAGEWVPVAASNVRVEDVLYVRPGEVFCADAVVVQGHSMVDEALLTGESSPVNKQVGDTVIAGSANLSGAVEVRVTKVGNDTQFSALVNLMASASTQKPNIALLADKIAQPFLWGVLLAASSALVYWWPTSPSQAVMSAVAVLIVTCPCALSLATPAAMLATAGSLANKGILVKQLQSIQSLAEVDTLVFDKTGTLTEKLQQVKLVGFRTDWTEQSIWQVAQQLARPSLHPVSQSLVNATPVSLDAKVMMSDWQEITGQGVQAVFSNFSKEPVSKDSTTKDSSNLAVKMGNATFCQIESDQALSKKALYLADAQGWLASFELDEQLKANVPQSVTKLKQFGYVIQLLSGDKIASVMPLAERIHLDVAKGALTAEQKLQHVRDLQLSGRRVLMVGDGLNDGPVIAAAHASIAMGSGVPLTQAQADMVVLNGDVSILLDLIQQAKKTIQVVKQNLLWAVCYNVACIPLAIAGLLPAWLAGLGMALSSIVVLLNALRLTQWQVSGHREAK